MKKILAIVWMLSLALTLICFASCNGQTPDTPGNDPDVPPTPPAHTCESKCTTCGKCTDVECTDAACQEKCAGHEASVTYTVRVVDANGNPIAGVDVQICNKKTGVCYKPTVKTDANGIAEFTRAAGEYKIQLNEKDSVAGYVYEKEEIAPGLLFDRGYYFEEDALHMEIVLQIKEAE